MRNLVGFIICFLASHSVAQEFESDTLIYQGDPSIYINYVILADGYTSSEQDKFIADASSFTDELFRQSPYKEYKNFFNVIAIKSISEESGANHPGDATDVSEPAFPVATVNNIFGSTFDFNGIHRLLVPTKGSIVNNVLAVNFPSYDQVIVLVNSPHYGGSGGRLATSSTNGSANEIAIHELGHSFARLIDEYYAGDQFSREGINMTAETSPEDVKWKNWYGDNGIGIYQHCCSGMSASWYKPHENCKMRALGRPFCSVCIEGTIEKIHSLVEVYQGSYPSEAELENADYPITFELDLILPDPNTVSVIWELNGTEVARNVDELLLEESMTESGENVLTVSVEDTTQLLRIDNHRHIDGTSWTFQSTTTSIEDVDINNFSVSVSPNPTSSVATITIDENWTPEYRIQLYTLSGELVQSLIPSNQKSIELNLSDLSQGLYMVHISKNGRSILTKQLARN